MINFSTEFPIDFKNSVSNAVELACDWVAGSPHTKLSTTEIRTKLATGIRTISADGESLSIALTATNEFEIGGIRWANIDTEGNEWTTRVVSLKERSLHTISIQVSCESSRTIVELPPPKKPIFVGQVLASLGGGMDGEIPVASAPYFLNEGEVTVAAALITGTGRNRLPIIYVSSTFDGAHVFDCKRLARDLSGLAHVVVEPSRAFSLSLKNLVESRNVFGGTVGIYWPESRARKAYYLSDRLPDGASLAKEIVKDIRLALANRRLRSMCTWSHVVEVISRQRIDELRERGSAELDDYAELWEAELKSKETLLRDSEREILRLNAEISRLATSRASGLLKNGSEQDFFESEIHDIAVEALRVAIRGARENSRRSHVLSDLIAANPTGGLAERYAEQVKNLLKSYVKMDSQTRRGLQALGFSLSEDGKHYKATYQGDNRYMFTFSKTSSDYRAGKNLVSTINGLLF